MTNPPQTNIALMSYNATGGNTPRSIGDRTAEVLNVKDFGATGNGSDDDYDALQNVLDLAFGTAVSPHGVANAHLNRSVFFPQGTYVIRQPLVLTKVYGGHIFGVGMNVTRIGRQSGSGTTLVTNDIAFTTIERINFAGGSGQIAMDINWDGTPGGGGLQGNVFSDMIIDANDIGIRLAHAGYGGCGNIFQNITLSAHSTAGIDIQSATALGNVVRGGGGYNNTTTYLASAGQFSCIICPSMASGTGYDFTFNSNFPCSILGGRTENQRSVNISNGIISVIGMTNPNVAGQVSFVNITGGKCIIEACYVVDNPVITGDGGILYLRGNQFPANYRSTWTGNESDVKQET